MAEDAYSRSKHELVAMETSDSETVNEIQTSPQQQGLGGPIDTVSSGPGGPLETVTCGLEGPINTVTAGPGGHIDTVTSGPGCPIDTVTSEPGRPIDTVTSEPGGQIDFVTAGTGGQIDTVTSGPGCPKDTVTSEPVGPIDTVTSDVESSAVTPLCDSKEMDSGGGGGSIILEGPQTEVNAPECCIQTLTTTASLPEALNVEASSNPQDVMGVIPDFSASLCAPDRPGHIDNESRVPHATPDVTLMHAPGVGCDVDPVSAQIITPDPTDVTISPLQTKRLSRPAVCPTTTMVSDTSQASDLQPQQVADSLCEHADAGGCDPLHATPRDTWSAPAEEMDTAASAEEGHHDTASQVVFDFSDQAVPSFVTWARTEYLTASQDNFLRGCKWSSAGSHILTNSNDNTLRVFSMSDGVTESDTSADIEQTSDLSLKESGTVYDYAWHPALDGGRIATTCSGIPMHLWDSNSGKIVASYKAYDQYDEITAAFSLTFSPSGDQLFGGYKKAIRVFDTEYSGKKCRLIRTCASKKKSYSQPSQTGIISCFAHSPTSPGVFVAGSYTRHVGAYDLRSEGPSFVFEGQKGGITHVMFTPDGNQLFTGARKDKEILCWDLRNLGTVCYSALRDVRTNQRMYFDISRSGRYMASGNDDGTVAFWDLRRPLEHIRGADYLRPVGQFQAHGDSANGVSFHPGECLLATTSGQRHFRNFDGNNGSNSASSDSDDDSDAVGTGGTVWDFSLRVWRMPLAVT